MRRRQVEDLWRVKNLVTMKSTREKHGITPARRMSTSNWTLGIEETVANIPNEYLTVKYNRKPHNLYHT